MCVPSSNANRLWLSCKTLETLQHCSTGLDSSFKHKYSPRETAVAMGDFLGEMGGDQVCTMEYKCIILQVPGLQP
jgi:hypothetical protein